MSDWLQDFLVRVAELSERMDAEGTRLREQAKELDRPHMKEGK